MNELRWPNTEDATKVLCILRPKGSEREAGAHACACVAMQAAREYLRMEMGWFARPLSKNRPIWYFGMLGAEKPPSDEFLTEMDALIAGVLAADALLKTKEAEREPVGETEALTLDARVTELECQAAEFGIAIAELRRRVSRNEEPPIMGGRR